MQNAGVRPAIAFLNGLTEHRYTSVFIFDGPVGKHAYFYDRLDPAQAQAPDILIDSSYCIYVKQSEETFNVVDALSDQRVEKSHPKRETIRSYCGVPLIDAYDNLIGSACHYDPDPMATDPLDVELLEALGRMIPKMLYRS